MCWAETEAEIEAETEADAYAAVEAEVEASVNGPQPRGYIMRRHVHRLNLRVGFIF